MSENLTTQLDAMVFPNWLDVTVTSFPDGIDPLDITGARMEIRQPNGSAWVAWDCTVHALAATSATFRHVYGSGDTDGGRGRYAVRVWYAIGADEYLSNVAHFTATTEF